ncbi:MAG: O-antigen ligase family protein [Solobacterium sp.]|nr:O-antigen ligase family protein [Solobacterium sp.]
MKINKQTAQMILRRLTILFVIIQPVIDMDYLVYDFLDRFGLPRFSTVIRFVILPLLVLASFFLRDKKKLRTLIPAVLYGGSLLVYFVLHTRQSIAIFDRLAFTDNFRFSTWQELTYVLTMVLPYGLTYVLYQEDLTMQEVKKIVLWISGLISVPILIGDLFVFARSTYYGYTVANVFSWFNGIYDWYHPRTLASKFFFNEGNTIGILLFMILPLLYYFFVRSQDKKEKRLIGTLIAVQSMSMQILATRVATYGAIVIPVLFLGFMVLDKLLNHTKLLNKNIIIFSLCMAALFGACLNYTPAIQNQKVDAVNDVALIHNGMAEEGRAILANAEDLIPGTPEYINFYVFMFEVYGIGARYIQSVPSMYYTEYYNYQVDPKFWVDVCFMDVYDRVNGRQIETIFFNYKYANLTSFEKILGMGYSSFMNGSIVLERDFKQQIYTLGYAGFLLTIGPWLVMLLYGVWMFVRHWKKLWNLENFCLVTALGAGLGSAYLSGHMLDQFLTSTFMALIIAVLLRKTQKEVQ